MEADIIRAGRVTIRVKDLERSRAFYVDALGFIETERNEKCIYLRGLEEFHHHSLILKKSEEPGVEALGFKVAHHDDLNKLAAFFENGGQTPIWKRKGQEHEVGDVLYVQDPAGIPLAFYSEMTIVERCLQRYELYRGARVQRIDHFNCAVPDVEALHHFYIDQLNYRCSEYTATEDDKIWASWLHRKPNVHDLALMNGDGPRLHHFAFWLSEPSSVLHTCDVLASLGYADAIERGPGRHGLSNAFFLYLRDPDGHRIELYSGDYFTGDPDFKPIRWEINDPRRQTFWGHKAPDCWFNETSPFVHVNEEVKIPIQKAVLKQRKPDFIT